jgi:hypothetical protein
MEFETITAEPIDDIMAGAKPRAPGDVPPPGGPGKGPSADAAATKPAGDAPIGGPAEEH